MSQKLLQSWRALRPGWLTGPVWRATVTPLMSLTLLMMAGPHALAAPDAPVPPSEPYMQSLSLTTDLQPFELQPPEIVNAPAQSEQMPLTRSGASSYTFQFINSDWSVRTNHTFLRSEPGVSVGLIFQNPQTRVKVTFQWYRPDGVIMVQDPPPNYPEYWYDPSGFTQKKGVGITIYRAAPSVVLGHWSVKVMVETETGAIVFEQALDFEVAKDPDNDPPGLYNYQRATTSKAVDPATLDPIEETTVFSTLTDDNIWASLKFDYYYLDIGTQVGLKFEWYYDEASVVFVPGLGLIQIPSPVLPCEMVFRIWGISGVDRSGIGHLSTVDRILYSIGELARLNQHRHRRWFRLA